MLLLKTDDKKEKQKEQADEDSPIGLRILDFYLKTHRMRLVDLFRISDKNKNWMLSKKELRDAIKKVIKRKKDKKTLAILSNQSGRSIVQG